MKCHRAFPQWSPRVADGSRILVVGASGGIGQAVVKMLSQNKSCCIGAHRSGRDKSLFLDVPESQIVDLPLHLAHADDAEELVDMFVCKAGGLDGMVVLCGAISSRKHFFDLTYNEWSNDLNINLTIPFFLSRIAMQHMNVSGGSIVLNGTESALHGGSAFSLGYGVAKSAIDCLVKGLAREGAKHSILINGVRLGFINSGFHQKLQGLDNEHIAKRVEMVPLKRSGKPEEVASLIVYLLSEWSQFITGKMFSIAGGDWL